MMLMLTVPLTCAVPVTLIRSAVGSRFEIEPVDAGRRLDEVAGDVRGQDPPVIAGRDQLFIGEEASRTEIDRGSGVEYRPGLVVEVVDAAGEVDRADDEACVDDVIVAGGAGDREAVDPADRSDDPRVGQEIGRAVEEADASAALEALADGRGHRRR